MAEDIFLKIDGINGESQDETHLNEIEILSWHWRIEQHSRMMSGSGGGAPKPTVHDMFLVHLIDKATPSLMSACLLGRRIPKAVLTLRKSGGTPLDFFKITMSDVAITSVESASGGGYHSETICLSFSAVKQEYTVQSATGGSAGVVTGAFNIKENRQG